ncbi:MAG TPA: D-2-hydroxyacid dehydrogenase [Bacteroidales bacterium]|nr:D-2-hydroxyacid dehydrogenase [Bacteroidales bacterium]
MKRPGIIFLDAETLGEVEGYYQLTRLGNLTVFQTTSKDQRIERIRGREIVITNKVVIDREVMDACPSLKLICIAATGMNNVDLEYAEKKCISVKNVAGYSTESVVQHTFSMLFYLMGNLRYYDDFVKQGSYTRGSLFTHHGRSFHELAGRHYGIIGMGTIGKRVAEVATVFGATVRYYSSTQKNLDTGYKSVSLHELLTGSDIISVHCPLTGSTRDLIGYEQLRVMKKEVILINAGRGGIVNEAGLARALEENLIGGAGLDVLEKEPPAADNPLLHITNPEKLFITPHIAWASCESRERLMDGIIQNITGFWKS